ncbi:MAG: hypothetical protein ACE5IY_16290, partial [bacterium]
LDFCNKYHHAPNRRASLPLFIKKLHEKGQNVRQSSRVLTPQQAAWDQLLADLHDGKGQKDRTVPIPYAILDELKDQIRRVHNLHQKDLQADYHGTFMFGAFEKKSASAAKEFIWQWLFPAKALTLVPETDERKRYHLHPTHVQKACPNQIAAGELPPGTSTGLLDCGTE